MGENAWNNSWENSQSNDVTETLYNKNNQKGTGNEEYQTFGSYIYIYVKVDVVTGIC